MTGRRAVALIVAVALGGFAAPAARAADGDELVGKWYGTVDGHQEVWTIKMEDGKWSVGITYTKNGREVGTSSGKDPKFANGTLTFVQKIDKRPPGVPWIDNAEMSVKKAGNKLTYTWTAGGSSGSRNLASSATPVKEAGTELVGMWKGAVDGVDEVWTVENKDGKWTVSGKYLRNGAEVGSFTGMNPRIVNGALTFVHKMEKVPDGVGWINGTTFTLRASGDKVSYTWRQGGRPSQPRPMEKVKP